MDNQNKKSYGSVPYKKVKNALTKIEQDFKDTETDLEDLEITFEYLVGSFFPEIIKNINEQLNHQYTSGYFQGRKDALDEVEIEEDED